MFVPPGVIEAFGLTVVRTSALVQNGTLEVESGATLRRIGGFTSAGLVVGGGTIEVGAGNNFINTGTVAPGSATGDPTGTLSITGNYAQGTNGQLNIEVGSTAPDGFDVLAITGSATIANPASPACSSAAMRWKTGSQSPRCFCRNRRMVGYQGLSSRSKSQRQSTRVESANHTGTPTAPAK